MKELKTKLLGFLSRKFLLALGGILFFVLGGALGNFDWNTVGNAVWKIIIGYIGIEGIADIKGR